LLYISISFSCLSFSVHGRNLLVGKGDEAMLSNQRYRSKKNSIKRMLELYALLGQVEFHHMIQDLNTLVPGYGCFHGFHEYRTTHVGSVENHVTSPCCIQAGILAPPNYTTNAAQKRHCRP
jgi:hypothetical protein